MPHSLSHLPDSQSLACRSGFVLLEFVFSIVIISTIAIALMKLTLSLHKQHNAKSSQTLAQISLANAADIVRNYLEVESSFQFVDFSLQLPTHSIVLQHSTLLLDGVMLAENITNFQVRLLPSQITSAQAFSVDLCASFASAKTPICVNRVGWLRS